METFRIELNFLGLSEEDVEGVLKIDNVNKCVCYEGPWQLIKKGSAVGPNNTKMVSYRLVTPLLSIDDIDDLKEVFTSLYELAGCIIQDDEPVKIYFGHKFRNGLARRIVYSLVSENKFMYTFIMYRKYFSELRFASFEEFSGGGVFIPYNTYFNTVHNGYALISVEELISETILSGSRPD